MVRVDEVCAAFRHQAEFCRELEAAFTAAMIDAAAMVFESNAAATELFEEYEEDLIKSVVALRFAGALQWLVLSGRGRGLTPFYDRLVIPANMVELSEPILDAIQNEPAVFKDFLARPVQTNEVGRCAALLGGFNKIAAMTGRPMDLLEIGASGGLLLAFDQYRYDFGGFTYGAGDIVLSSDWRGPRPDWRFPIDVGARLGCDLNPMDLTSDEALRRVDAYIWPEQKQRKQLFRRAAKQTVKSGVIVDKMNADTWLEKKLAARNAERTTVMYQSVMDQYLDDATRQNIRRAVEEEGANARAEAPLAWLRFEPDFENAYAFYTDLTLWPGGESYRVCEAHPHGAWVKWLDNAEHSFKRE